MGGASEETAAGLDPAGDPLDHGIERGGGISELGAESGAVAEEGGGGFDAFEARLGVEKRGETPGEIAHGEGFGAAEVPGGRRGTGEGKRPEDHFIGVRLPDAVDAAIGELDGKSGVDLSGDVHQDAIAELDGVEETDQRDGCARQAGVVLKDAFPADGRVGVLDRKSTRLNSSH